MECKAKKNQSFTEQIRVFNASLCTFLSVPTFDILFIRRIFNCVRQDFVYVSET